MKFHDRMRGFQFKQDADQDPRSLIATSAPAVFQFRVVAVTPSSFSSRVFESFVFP